MSLLPKVSVYQDQMSTDSANKVGMEELTSREASNVITDILNADWQNWTPTLTWTGTTPLGLTTVAKYTQIGRTVFFQFQTARAATTNLITNSALTISLPVDPSTDAMSIPAEAYQLAYTGSTYTDMQGYIDTTTTGPSSIYHLIKFRNYVARIGGSIAEAIYINGFYPVED